jgi:transcriptional regulator with PAS, ATPase and Fis domain
MSTEKTIIKKALERTNWNRKKAAGLLDISYKSLLNKIKQYRLAHPDRVPFDSIRNNGS